VSKISLKINCPISKKEEVLPLIELGATDFYCGINSSTIFQNSDEVINRRPQKWANFSSINDLKETINFIHINNGKISIVFNEHTYTDFQISKIVEFLANIEIDSVVISSLSLIIALKKTSSKIELILSTAAHVLNNSSIAFFAEFDIKKMVLPRHLSIKEIILIKKSFPELNFEVFVFNQDCANIDGLCRYSHGIFHDHNVACHNLSSFEVAPNFYKEILPPDKYNDIFNDCGVCSLWDFSRNKISSVKLVGRCESSDEKIKNFIFLKTLFSYLTKSRKEYQQLAKDLYRQTFKMDCKNKCLYRG
jgi:collagenase-like PrtC family protease